VSLELILSGIKWGILVSIPMGPIGVLCVQRTLNNGRLAGFISGLGAAFADTFFATIAGLGLSFIINFFEKQQVYLLISGGMLLIGLGIKIFITDTIEQFRQKQKKRSIAADFISVFFLTLSNPLTILFFGVVFAGLDLIDKENTNSIYSVLLGIFSGALLWWFTLSSVVSLLKNRFRLRWLWWFNKIAGIIIVVFGIVVSISVFYNPFE